MDSKRCSTTLTEERWVSETDAELVRRAAQGEGQAFDALVMRYRRHVLQAVYAQLGDWQDAEDVAQQAFISAYRGLRSLHDAATFRAWLLTIARRKASRLLDARKPAPLEFSDAVFSPANFTSAETVDEELIERIRIGLREVSARHRQVITLYYLDGYSCGEIGSRLRIPPGTVKRILFESRQSLRAGLGLPTRAGRPRGDRKTMRATPEPSSNGVGSRDLTWWVSGYFPGGRTNSSLAHAICLAINKQALTTDQIGEAVAAHPRYVKEMLESLVQEDLVSELSGDRYQANFAALDAADWLSLTRDIPRKAARVADSLQPRLPVLEEAWNRTRLPAQRFDWQIGSWVTVGVLICNTGLSRHSPQQPEPPERESGGRYWFAGHEEVQETERLWMAGFVSEGGGGESLAYGHWWSPGDTPYVAPAEERTPVLDTIAKGADDPAQIAEKTGFPLERTREAIAHCLELGLVKRQSGKLALSFPVVVEQDSDVLYPVVDQVAAQLVEEVLLPDTADTADRLHRMGYGHVEEQFPLWRSWMEILVAGEGVHELVKRGALPAPGDPVPANFCTLGWYTTPHCPSVLEWKP
jgi:RNA polymerase sigma-70 factor (ECF subfamily)